MNLVLLCSCDWEEGLFGFVALSDKFGTYVLHRFSGLQLVDFNPEPFARSLFLLYGMVSSGFYLFFLQL